MSASHSGKARNRTKFIIPPSPKRGYVRRLLPAFDSILPHQEQASPSTFDLANEPPIWMLEDKGRTLSSEEDEGRSIEPNDFCIEYC